MVIQGRTAHGKRTLLRLIAWVLRHRAAYEAVGRLARFCLRRMPGVLRFGPVAAWARGRELPPAPAESFRDMMRRGR
jgi:L-lactate dehydrogenase complex protein LldF